MPKKFKTTHLPISTGPSGMTCFQTAKGNGEEYMHACMPVGVLSSLFHIGNGNENSNLGVSKNRAT